MAESDLGERLRQARKLQGRPLQETAAAAGISAAYLVKLERNEVASPSPHILHRLAEALNLEYVDLMRGAGYVVPTTTRQTSGALSAAFSSAGDLDEDEIEAVAEFLKLLRKQRRKD